MASAITTPGPCALSPSCNVSGTGYMGYWASRAYTSRELTGTYVVVQIINTVSNTTSISNVAENVPAGFKPPPTNSDGTRTADVTYTHRGSVITTTLAYPTPYLKMPNSYTVIGDYQLPNSSAGLQCVKNANKSYDVAFNAQPSWRLDDPKWNLSQYYDEKDPLGWTYNYGDPSSSSLTRFFSIDELIDLLPDNKPDMPHSMVKKCYAQFPPQPFVAKFDPNWKVVGTTSVVYVGEKAADLSPAAAKPSAPVPEVKPPATTTAARQDPSTPAVAESKSSVTPDKTPATLPPGTTPEPGEVKTVAKSRESARPSTQSTTRGAAPSTTGGIVASLGNHRGYWPVSAGIWMCLTGIVWMTL